jgi:hypothetical protein
VCFRIPSELTSKGSARQAVYVLSSAIESVFESTRGSTLENGLQCVLWSVLGVYFKPSWEVTCEDVANQAGSLASSAIGNIFENMLGSILESIIRALM